jgi:hypothetical protein
VPIPNCTATGLAVVLAALAGSRFDSLTRVRLLQVARELRLDSRHCAHATQRIAAQCVEIIVGSDAVNFQHLGPNRCQDIL